MTKTISPIELRREATRIMRDASGRFGPEAQLAVEQARQAQLWAGKNLALAQAALSAARAMLNR